MRIKCKKCGNVVVKDGVAVGGMFYADDFDRYVHFGDYMVVCINCGREIIGRVLEKVIKGKVRWIVDEG